MLLASLVSLASLFIGQAIAHGGVTSYVIDGKAYPGWKPLDPADDQPKTIARRYANFGPILSTSDSNLACNFDGQPGEGQFSAHVRGGSVITANYQQQAHDQGPVLVYMANCHGPCTKANSSELRWFKIAETGFVKGTGNLYNGTWGMSLVKKTLSYNATIPRNLAHGEYLIRHEIIALHVTGNPQFYPNCAQLVVHGLLGVNPPRRFLTKFPGAYSPEDPGLAIDIYSDPTADTYKTPGPAVWRGQIL